MRIVAGPAILLALTVAVPAAAHAAGATVQVQFVKASKQPGPLDPALKNKLGPLNYQSVQSVGQQQVQLAAGAPQTVSMPDGKQLTLELAKIVKGQAHLKVSIPGAVQVGPNLSHGQSFPVGGKKLPYDGGELWVILTPVQIQP